MPFESHTQIAERHIREARKLIAQQEARVVRLRRRNLDTVEADRLLGQLRKTLEVFEAHLQIMLAFPPRTTLDAPEPVTRSRRTDRQSQRG